ncbi:hypothetical protein GGE68_006274 [Rhizobium leguminosarum]|uniref:hypothetical protein n=1 Tax=Rhizobium leguminosarum TaxID=384 RepID=UPI0016170894|nr:hypothetical protein [Rhizobium leguminosarum]MBB5668024.1 hypothetical protein [Rhizobium leguminosarum]
MTALLHGEDRPQTSAYQGKQTVAFRACHSPPRAAMGLGARKNYSVKARSFQGFRRLFGRSDQNRTATLSYFICSMPESIRVRKSAPSKNVNLRRKITGSVADAK